MKTKIIVAGMAVTSVLAGPVMGQEKFVIDDPEDSPLSKNGLDYKKCISANNTCTLRAAIQTANAINAEYAIMTFSSSLAGSKLYLNERGRTDKKEAAVGDLDIMVPMEIQGNNVIIDATDLEDRVFHIHGTNVKITDLTIVNGTVLDSTDDKNGGCLLSVDSSVELNNVSFEGCKAIGNGGAVASHVFNPYQASAFFFLPAAYATSPCNIRHGRFYPIGGSRLYYNNVDTADSIADDNGGGLFIMGSCHDVEIENSTFRANRAQRGGAVYADTSLPIEIKKSNRFLENRATIMGGAICKRGAEVINNLDRSYYQNNYCGGDNICHIAGPCHGICEGLRIGPC